MEGVWCHISATPTKSGRQAPSAPTLPTLLEQEHLRENLPIEIYNIEATQKQSIRNNADGTHKRHKIDSDRVTNTNSFQSDLIETKTMSR